MEGKANRNAIFVCSIAISKPTGQVLTYTGKCSGIILHNPAGTNGFGYDPFLLSSPRKDICPIISSRKSRVSHRGQAMRKLKDDFQRIFIWMEDKIR